MGYYAPRSLGEMGYLGAAAADLGVQDAVATPKPTDATDTFAAFASGLLKLGQAVAPGLVDTYVAPRTGTQTADLLKALASGHPVVAQTDPRPSMVATTTPSTAVGGGGFLDRASAFVQTPLGAGLALVAAFAAYKAVSKGRRR